MCGLIDVWVDSGVGGLSDVWVDSGVGGVE